MRPDPGRFAPWRSALLPLPLARPPWTALPAQGLVLDWRRAGTNHQALVAYVNEALHPKRIITEWMPAEKLTPIRADPNVIDYGRSPWDSRRRQAYVASAALT